MLKYNKRMEIIKMSKERRPKRTYTNEFKEQIVKLYNNGKSRSDLIKEYELTPSTLAKWINNYNNTGSFLESENRTDDQNQLIEARKRIKHLEMEVDILKQAALIMGRK